MFYRTIVNFNGVLQQSWSISNSSNLPLVWNFGLATLDHQLFFDSFTNPLTVSKIASCTVGSSTVTIDSIRQLSFQIEDMASCSGFGLTLPSVQVSASDTSVCSGQKVNFTATPGLPGSRPQYQWVVNSKKVGIDSTGFSYVPKNGDTVQCILLSNDYCAYRVDATSPSIIMQVEPIFTPSITIGIDDTGMICRGTAIILKSNTAKDSTATYQWHQNNNLRPNDTNATLTTIPGTSDSFFAVVYSKMRCRSADSAFSNLYSPLIGSPTPQVFLSDSPGGTPCAGSLVTLTATPSYGGISPIYTWLRNGIPIAGAGNASVFSSNIFADNDQVSVQLLSSISCANPKQVASSPITLHFNPILKPTAYIQALPSTTICDGTLVTFKSTIGSGGSAPSYQWLLNDAVLSAETKPNYSSNVLLNGDRLKIWLQSSETCAQPDTAISNELTMTVNPNIIPTVSITVNPSGNIIAGIPLKFSAHSTGGGTKPIFQWLLNGVDIPGTRDSVYITGLLRGFYRISVRLQSSEPCATPVVTTSEEVNGRAEEMFAIYPNPNNGTFSVVVPGTDKGKYALYDAVGKFIYRDDFSTSPFLVRVPKVMSAGVYLLRVETEGGRQYQGKVEVR